MRKGWWKRLAYTFVLTIVTAYPLSVEAENGESRHQGGGLMPEAFTADRISLQVMAGAFYSPFFTLLFPDNKDLDYAQLNVRFGWMLNEPEEDSSILRGNYEVIFELTNSTILKGEGHFIGGFSLLLRYNFVQKDAWFIPYAQMGGGIVYNDVYKDQDQNAIGQSIEFLINVSLGSHLMIARNWSIDVEAMFQHISNAGLDDRNKGNNALGGLLGVTYFF